MASSILRFFALWGVCCLGCSTHRFTIASPAPQFQGTSRPLDGLKKRTVVILSQFSVRRAAAIAPSSTEDEETSNQGIDVGAVAERDDELVRRSAAASLIELGWHPVSELTVQKSLSKDDVLAQLRSVRENSYGSLLGAAAVLAQATGAEALLWLDGVRARIGPPDRRYEVPDSPSDGTVSCLSTRDNRLLAYAGVDVALIQTDTGEELWAGKMASNSLGLLDKPIHWSEGLMSCPLPNDQLDRVSCARGELPHACRRRERGRELVEETLGLVTRHLLDRMPHQVYQAGSS